MQWKIVIQREDQTVYEQVVEELDLRAIINAVNPTSMKQRKPRSDTGKRRRFDANEEAPASIDSLV